MGIGAAAGSECRHAGAVSADWRARGRSWAVFGVAELGSSCGCGRRRRAVGAGSGSERVDRFECRCEDVAVLVAGRETED